MRQRRKFTRVGCSNTAVVEVDNVLSMKVKMLNLSLDGALFELLEFFTFRNKDRWRLRFRLPRTEITLELDTEVVHAKDNLVGVRFVDADRAVLAHLQGLIESGSVVEREAEGNYIFPVTG